MQITKGCVLSMMLMAAALLLHMPAADAASRENYLFVLQGLNSPFKATILDRSYVDGMALQIGWREVEPTQGSYDWHRVDQFVQEASSRNKRVTLHLLPLHPPEWVYSAGAEKYCFTMPARGDFMPGRERCEMLPWDSVFLDRWSRLVAEFGKHYNSNPAVLAVSVTAPAPEMVLPGAIPRTPAFADMERRYKKDVYLSAWKKMIDAYQNAFPGKIKFVAPGIVLFDEYFADDVISYAQGRFGEKLWLFNAGLRANGVPQKSMGSGHIAALLEVSGRKGKLGLQTIWSATEDPNNRMLGSLADALAQGLKMGAGYFEVYAVDIQNSALQSSLTEFKRKLGKLK